MTRKKIAHTETAAQHWIDVPRIAEVEITSEAEEAPIEGAFEPTTVSGWRASAPGPQTIRLIFDEPQKLRHLHLRFVEPYRERTQEFSLSWAGSLSHPLKGILRQQWNFGPFSSTEEVEDYTVNLPAVSVLQLDITPDIQGGDATATLAELRIA